MINKAKLYKLIFHSDTPAGKRFDIILLWIIGLSVLITMVESLPNISTDMQQVLTGIEWFFTILFSVEYLLRVYISTRPSKYIFSFWGIIDLLSILPTYISLILYGYQYLLIVRILRFLRIFRVLRMVRFSHEGNTLLRALKASSYKIGIFFFTVICFVTILGTIMYVVEGPENGFTSIFQSIYWAIITITTVGYGDIVPQTVLGKFISSIIMIFGYAIIAVPTGIVTSEMSNSPKNVSQCPTCKSINTDGANFCSNCGSDLHGTETTNN